MSESKFLKELKACRDDDELKIHLEARLACSDSTALPTLVHNRLRHAQQFRLLTLLPGSLKTDIKCNLKTFELDSPPEFLALSYAWGDKARTLPIECNEQSVLISINLYSALLRIRLPDRKLTVWIDALCIDQAINQDSLRERAEQVRRMDQIFTKASEIIIDLGGANKNEIRRFTQGCHDFHRLPGKASLYGPNDPFWMVLSRFFARPWFSRVWILQEFILARKTTMLMGSAKIDPSDVHVMSFNAILYRQSTLMDSYTRLSTGKPNFVGLINELQSSKSGSLQNDMIPYQIMCRMFGQKQSLLALLDLSRHMEATDTRDHIYALAGLTANWDDFDIQIDYTQSEAAVRLSVGRALIITGHSFYCLARASGIDPSAMTWMPLLRNPPYERNYNNESTRTFMGLHYPLYRAAGSTTLDVTISDTHTFLAITGFRVDTVKIFAPNPPILTQDIVSVMRQDWNEIGLSFLRWYLALREWTIQAFPEWSLSDAKHNLWRTLLLDVVKDNSVHLGYKARASLSLLNSHFRGLEVFSGAQKLDNISSNIEQEESDNWAAHIKATGNLRPLCRGRKICRTEQGRIANLPHKAAHGNEIWILLGIPLPMVLRNLGPAYAIVGPAHVQGLMDGEALEEMKGQKQIVYLA